MNHSPFIYNFCSDLSGWSHGCYRLSLSYGYCIATITKSKISHFDRLIFLLLGSF